MFTHSVRILMYMRSLPDMFYKMYDKLPCTWCACKTTANCTLACVHFRCICHTHVCSLYSKMTMEVILATAFGRSVDVQGGAGGRIVEAAYEIFSTLMPGANDKPQPFIVALQILSRQFECT